MHALLLIGLTAASGIRRHTLGGLRLRDLENWDASSLMERLACEQKKLTTNREKRSIENGRRFVVNTIREEISSWSQIPATGPLVQVDTRSLDDAIAQMVDFSRRNWHVITLRFLIQGQILSGVSTPALIEHLEKKQGKCQELYWSYSKAIQRGMAKIATIENIIKRRGEHADARLFVDVIETMRARMQGNIQ
jgi:hypothetical protein